MACLYSELHQSEAYLEPSQISTIEPSQENSQRLLATNYFYKKVPRQTLAWTLNTPLSLDHGIKFINFAKAVTKIKTKS